MSRTTPIRVVVVDDHEVVLDGLVSMLDGLDALEVVGRATCGESGLACVLDRDPDVAVLDVSMPRGSGVWVARQLSKRGCRARVVLLTSLLDETLRRDAALYGVLGFVHKTDGRAALLDAIEAAAEGRAYASESLGAENASQVKTSGLTPRERAVVELVCQGLTAPQIGAALSVSPRTVETHRARAMAKLEAGSIAELVRAAARVGIILP